jgi:putative MATE family efflux protein
MNRFIIKDKNFYKRLLTIVLPIIGQNLITFSLNFIDIIMLGFLGENELAACSLANMPFFVFILLIFGLTSGCSVLISQYWGKGDNKTINSVLGMGLVFSFVVSFLIFLLVFLFPHQVMGIFTDKPILIALGVRYLKIVAISYVFTAISTTYIAALRSVENPLIGLYLNGAAMIINTFLNWVFIFGNLGAPKMGIEGAALATAIARFLELSAVIVYAFFFDKRLKISLTTLFKPKIELLKDFIKITTPVVLNETLWSGGIAMYSVVYGRLGADVVAGQTIAGNIDRLFMVFVVALANGCAVLCGKEFGASRFESGYKMAKTFLFLSAIVGLISCIVMLILSPVIVIPFQISKQAKEFAQLFIVCYAILTPIKSFNCTNIVGVLRSGGDVKWALGIDISTLWLVSVPLSLISAFVFKLPLIYVILAIMLDEIIKVFLGLWRFTSKKWVKNITKDFESEIPLIME